MFGRIWLLKGVVWAGEHLIGPEDTELAVLVQLPPRKKLVA